jgi:hypothetical protein
MEMFIPPGYHHAIHDIQIRKLSTSLSIALTIRGEQVRDPRDLWIRHLHLTIIPGPARDLHSFKIYILSPRSVVMMPSSQRELDCCRREDVLSPRMEILHHLLALFVVDNKTNPGPELFCYELAAAQ